MRMAILLWTAVALIPLSVALASSPLLDRIADIDDGTVRFESRSAPW